MAVWLPEKLSSFSVASILKRGRRFRCATRCCLDKLVQWKKIKLFVDSNWLPWWRIKWLYFLLVWPEILYCLKIVILLSLCQPYNCFLSFKYCQSHLCLHKSCLDEKKETSYWTVLNLLLCHSRVGNTGLRGAMKCWWEVLLRVNQSSGVKLQNLLKFDKQVSIWFESVSGRLRARPV